MLLKFNEDKGTAGFWSRFVVNQIEILPRRKTRFVAYLFDYYRKERNRTASLLFRLQTGRNFLAQSASCRCFGVLYNSVWKSSTHNSLWLLNLLALFFRCLNRHWNFIVRSQWPQKFTLLSAKATQLSFCSLKWSNLHWLTWWYHQLKIYDALTDRKYLSEWRMDSTRARHSSFRVG